MRICNRCGIEKELVMFALKPKGKDGRNRVCKQCKVEENQMRQFGMTTKDALEITSTCHLCGIELSKSGRVCIDHDHNTRKVRGILCTNCNAGLGKLGDDIEGLERALRYLTSPPLIN